MCDSTECASWYADMLLTIKLLQCVSGRAQLLSNFFWSLLHFASRLAKSLGLSTHDSTTNSIQFQLYQLFHTCSNSTSKYLIWSLKPERAERTWENYRLVQWSCPSTFSVRCRGLQGPRRSRRLLPPSTLRMGSRASHVPELRRRRSNALSREQT